MVNDFYKKLIKNLDSNGVFCRYGNEKFYYKDLKDFFLKFKNLINFLPKKITRYVFYQKKDLICML